MQRISCVRAASALFLVVSLAACGGSSTEQTLDDVRALQDSGAYAETLEPLRELLAKEPSHPEANYRLGLALLRTGRHSAAVFPLKKAAEDATMARQAGLVLASTLAEMDNFEEAIRATDYVLKHDPENEAALLARAQAALGANNPTLALETAEKLIKIRPDDTGHRTILATALMGLGRLDEAEKILLGLESQPWESDPSGQGRACLVVANFYGRFRGGPERGAAKIKECLKRFPDDLSLEPLAAQGYDEIDRPEESMKLLRGAFARSPEDGNVRRALSKRLLAEGKRSEGEALMAEGARSSGDPQSWLHLAGVRRTNGDPPGALEAIDEAIALAPNAPELKFARADILIDLGRIDEAEAYAAQIEEDTFLRVLRGRIALERGNPKEALAQIGPAIEQWPTNAGARILAARAAYELGDEARALSELREASRAEPKDTDAALLLARLLYARGDYEQSAEFAWRHVTQRGTGGAEAHRIGVRADVARGEYDEARRFVADLRKKGGFDGVALSEEARIAAREKGSAAGVAVLRAQASKLGDPAYEDPLHALVELEVGSGHVKEARALVDGIAAKRADSAPLQALRGELAFAAGDRAAAAAAFESALKLDPKSAPALAGQAKIARADGHTAEAVALLDRAAAEGQGDPRYAYEAAQALLAAGDTAAARKRLETLLSQHPEDGAAANDLAWLLASEGQDLDRAVQLAERARRVVGGAEVLDTLGFVQLQRGDANAAIGAFEEALRVRPGYATARYHLGLALALKGDRDGARNALRTALDAGSFPEAEQARTELAKLEAGGGGKN